MTTLDCRAPHRLPQAGWFSMLPMEWQRNAMQPPGSMTHLDSPDQLRCPHSLHLLPRSPTGQCTIRSTGPSSAKQGPAPSPVGQHVTIGKATERSATTRSKDLPGSPCDRQELSAAHRFRASPRSPDVRRMIPLLLPSPGLVTPPSAAGPKYLASGQSPGQSGPKSGHRPHCDLGCYRAPLRLEKVAPAG